MKASLALCACVVLLVAGCEGWPANSITYNPSIPPASRTPSVQTATPLILSPVPITSTAPADTETPTATNTAIVEASPTGTTTPTILPPVGQVSTEILGCDTSIDVLHGMGEVTNAYVLITNTTAADAANLCATLRALDEGRPHPDKTKCLASLPAGHQVTLKLTVDSTYKENTPVQVDVTSGDSLLERVGEPSCKSIGLLLPDVGSLDTPQPAP